MSVDEDNDIPKWQQPLLRPPIRVLDATKADELASEMEERLAAVLRRYQCDPTPAGWRDLALRLLLEYEPAFQIETPVDRLKGEPGAEPSPSRWLTHEILRTVKRRLRLEGRNERGLDAAAAREVAPESALSETTLRNMLSDKKIKAPRFVRRIRYERVAKDALAYAAKELDTPRK